MKRLRPHFNLDKRERNGVFFLLLLLFLFQGVWFGTRSKPKQSDHSLLYLDTVAQARYDSLSVFLLKKREPYRLNPNFLTDAKGYALGIPVTAMDKLLAFRKTGGFVNSLEGFQALTGVSDELLETLAVHFRFPEFTSKNPRRNGKASRSEKIGPSDLNLATPEALTSIRGIGKVLSQRIVKYRELLGGFLVNAQLYEVYGLEPEVVERCLVRFQVLQAPQIEKIPLNEATVKELSRLVYIDYGLARRMVAYRRARGRIGSFEELFDLEGFPVNKIDIIQLYLSL
ncbi:MAG: helix-hairpin-helix domain-containing protein [Flavobacteriaceae bacterium]|nr:helix-hairpin-helix domain-containing protein [Flavobacteriaceae bacterium]